MTPDEALKKAVELVGNNDSELARKIGATQNAVWQAKQRGKVSAEMAMAIEQALAGAVKARELRPDLPWPNNDTSEAADANASAA
jgi:DNA-binding transcriptional regulator YdaS (Cro superfamily)